MAPVSFIPIVSLLGAAALVPLFFGSWTLGVLSLAAGAAWLGNAAFFEKRLRVSMPFFVLPFPVFFSAVAASSFLSADRIGSLAGRGAELLLFSAFALLFLHVVRTRRALDLLSRVFVWGLGASGLLGAGLLLGWWKIAGLALAPSAHESGVLAALFLLLLLSTPVSRGAVGTLARLAALVGGFWLLALLNSPPAWAVLSLGLVLLLLVRLANRVALAVPFSLSSLWLPVALLAGALVFLLSAPPSLPALPAPPEVRAGHLLSWQVAAGQLAESPKDAVLGVGPGTFPLAFAQLKPASWNTTPGWQERGVGPQSFLAELLATTGLLGFLSYVSSLLLVLAGSVLLFSSALGRRDQITALGQLPGLSALPALFLSQVLLPQSAFLLFPFWFLLASSAARLRGAGSGGAPAPLGAGGRALAGLLAFTLIAAAGAAAFWGQRAWRAELLVGETQSISHLQESLALWPFAPERETQLAQLYVERGLEGLGEPEGERNEKQISQDMQEAVARARRAVELSPNSPAAWAGAGDVYARLRAVPGAVGQGIEAYERAVAQDPKNPEFRVALAELFTHQQRYEEAEHSLRAALAFKEGYLEAAFQLALVTELQGRGPEALDMLEALASQNPSHPELLFQMGRMYYNAGRDGEAVARLRASLQLDPSSSNARYTLALALERQGLGEEALRQFELVLRANPDNEELQEAVQRLAEPR